MPPGTTVWLTPVSMTTAASAELNETVRLALDQFLASELERKGAPGIALTKKRADATHVLDIHISHVQIEILEHDQSGAAAGTSLISLGAISLGLVASAQLVNLETGKAERNSVETGEWPTFVGATSTAPPPASATARAEHRESLVRSALVAFGSRVLSDLGLTRE